MYGPSITKILSPMRTGPSALREHVGFFAHVGVHRRCAAGCRIGDADGQVLIAVPLPFHDMHIFARPRIDHVQLTLGKGEVFDVVHRRRLDRPRHSSRLQHLVGMVLGVQLRLRFVGSEDHLAVLDLLPRLCIGRRMVHHRFRQKCRTRLHLGRTWSGGRRTADEQQRQTKRAGHFSRTLNLHRCPPLECAVLRLA